MIWPVRKRGRIDLSATAKLPFGNSSSGSWDQTVGTRHVGGEFRLVPNFVPNAGTRGECRARQLFGPRQVIDSYFLLRGFESHPLRRTKAAIGRSLEERDSNRGTRCSLNSRFPRSSMT
jgi:hypothetical protein